MDNKYIEFAKKHKEILDYVANYHTAELVKLLIPKRDNKKEAAKVAAAIALRNSIKTFDVRTLHRAALYHTDHLIDKVNQKWNEAGLNDREKKRKISRYCAAIAIRNGLHDDWWVLVELAKMIL